jgi:hypothetical protein
MNGKIGLRIVSALVLVAAIAGIAFFAYQAGITNGSPVTIQAPSGDANVAPAPYPYYGYGYGMPFRHPFGFGFGCFGAFLVFFLVIVALKSFRFLFWGPRWGHHMGHWGQRWEGGAPPMFDEWHKKAHGEQPEEKKE